jgi:hypothetical protein
VTKMASPATPPISISGTRKEKAHEGNRRAQRAA